MGKREKPKPPTGYKKADIQVDNITRLGRDATPKRTSQSSEPVNSSVLSFRGKLVAAFLVVGIGSLAKVGVNSMKSEPQATSVSKLDKVESENSLEITLGNVSFYAKRSDLPEAEAGKLELMLRSAYETLSRHFGAELMQLKEPIRLPITIEHERFFDMAVDMEFDASFQEDGGYKIDSNTINYQGFALSSDFSKMSVAVVAHELVHLFLQKGGLFGSEAFSEGHANAIQTNLYSTDVDLNASKEFFKKPELNEVFNLPMDSSGLLPLNLEDHPYTNNFKNFIHERFSQVWQGFFDTHPEFLRDFYRQINEVYHSGSWHTLNKDALLEIASGLEPDFEKWYSEQSVLHDVENHTMHRAVVDTENNRLILAGYTTIAKRVVENSNGGLDIKSPEFQVMTDAKITVTANGGALVLNINVDLLAVEHILLPEPFRGFRDLEVVINGNYPLSVSYTD